MLFIVVSLRFGITGRRSLGPIPQHSATAVDRRWLGRGFIQTTTNYTYADMSCFFDCTEEHTNLLLPSVLTLKWFRPLRGDVIPFWYQTLSITVSYRGGQTENPDADRLVRALVLELVGREVGREISGARPGIRIAELVTRARRSDSAFASEAKDPKFSTSLANVFCKRFLAY